VPAKLSDHYPPGIVRARRVVIFAGMPDIGAAILRAHEWSDRTRADVRVCALANSSQVLTIASGQRADLVVVPAPAAVRGSSRARETVLEVIRACPCPVLVDHQHAASGHILAATDLSDPAIPAVRAAAEESRRRRARLTVLHCLEAPPVAVDPWHVLAGCGGHALEAALELRRIAGARIWSRLQRSVPGACMITEGAPARAILDQAREADTELIVMGARAGYAHRRGGNVVGTVVGAAICPVLVVRLQPPPDENEDDDEPPEAA
jgi:nucleotide-binding universal stress UspA family protein